MSRSFLSAYANKYRHQQTVIMILLRGDCMSEVQGISREPPLVRIMEQEHGKLQAQLTKFLKSSIYKTIIFTLLPILPGVFVKDWGLMINLPIITAVFYIFSIRKVLKSINLAKVGNILFTQTNIGSMINIEDVHNSTLLICEMKGVINGIAKAINVYSVCEIILIVLNVISHLLIYLLGGK